MFGRKRLAQLEARVVQAEAALAEAHSSAGLAPMGAALEGHTAWLQAIERGLTDLRTAHTAQLEDLGRWLAATTHTVSSLSTTPVLPSAALQAIGPQAQLVDERVMLARANQVWTVSRWLAQMPAASTVLISVVIPTRNRRTYLERAVASVVAQRHSAFELIIVDDGSTDDTAAFLADVTDPRIRSLRTTGVGTSAARNLGLEAARGEIVTHLDDDNLMDPDWLHGVAWGFARWPDTELLYGARIVEDGFRQRVLAGHAVPGLVGQLQQVGVQPPRQFLADRRLHGKPLAGQFRSHPGRT